MSRAVIFVNGLLSDPSTSSGQRPEPARRLIRPDDVLLAADGGTRHALALGLMPSVIIGDLDSLTVDNKRQMVEKGVRLIQHPTDKDQTDLELALQYAVEAGHQEILLVGALGRRLDMTLGNLSLLTDPALAKLDIRADDGVEEVFFTRGSCWASSRASRGIRGSPGDLVSLLPWGGEVSGVTTDGLRWPLHGETLFPDRTRGISNEMLDETASIEIASGLLLIVHRRSTAP